MKNPVCLIIRDGWGHNDNPKGNAVLAAKTPFTNYLFKNYSQILLNASGEPVGLPSGYQGSSEVGHLNFGAGRIVIQELKRIDDGLKDKSFFKLENWQKIINKWKNNNSTLHLLGLLQDEGVHAHQEHLFKILQEARIQNPNGQIIVHPFLDGRDTPPRSCLEFLAKLNIVLKQIKKAKLGVMMGRYYGMDRSKNWELTKIAYNALTKAIGQKYKPENYEEAIKNTWQNDKTPDNFEMVDEYIKPLIPEDYLGMKNGDCVIHTNFRQDRAIQLTQVFINPDEKLKINYLGLTRYYDEFENYLLPPLGGEKGLIGLLGGVVANNNLTQLRLAETQKFRHVTSFFNGKSTKPFKLEEQVEIKGRFDPASFASHPEMEAYILTETFLNKYLQERFPLIVINYANCDMVGHTGVFEATKKAVETVDDCLSKIVPQLLEKGYHVFVTADHGNAEQMIDYETNLVKTSHTTFPVDCFYVSSNPLGTLTKKVGKLSDLAPTILKVMGLEVPPEMTAENLLLNNF